MVLIYILIRVFDWGVNREFEVWDCGRMMFLFDYYVIIVDLVFNNDYLWWVCLIEKIL